MKRFFTFLKSKKGINLAIVSLILLILPLFVISASTKQQSQQYASEAYVRQTINFNDFRGQDVPLDGQYPIGIIDWGKNVWLVTPPWGLFTTKSVEFASRGVKSGDIRFVTPVKVVSLNLFNGGGRTATEVAISCANNPSIKVTVSAEKTATLLTKWTNLCNLLSITIANGWNTSIDDIVIDVPQNPGQITSIPTVPYPTTIINIKPSNTQPTSPVVTKVPVPVVIPSSAGGIWHPALNTSWQWQLSTPVNQSVNAQMYDIDGFENDATVVSSLHAKGAKVVCYMSFGSYEDWRPDANQFPSVVLGSSNGWPGEKWLDIRNISVLAPIIRSRLDLCKQKGFDGVEPDNIDGYTNKTGFPLTALDQITYNKFLATEAHARGLSIGLKNDTNQLKELVPYFDWALNEQCFQYGECSGYSSTFIAAGKAVFEVEYSLATTQFCSQANALNFNSLKKDLNLSSTRTACR
jgi:hypothetical protein